MSDKKQTAVDWLVNKLNNDFENNDFLISYANEISKAKEMESNKNKKFDEMLEMLKNIFEDYDYAIDNWQELEQIIKEATEI
jgi:mevalonate kinase